MHDQLLRRALESKKTVSRKQKSKQNSAETSRASSRQGSAANSRTASRIGSRDNSDDEDGNLSDGTEFSSFSIDGVLSGAGGPDSLAPPINWAEELSTRVNHLLERSRRNQEEREQDLRYYVSILRRHFAQDEITGRVPALCKAFVRGAQAGSTEVETTVALKALQITVLTEPNEDYFASFASSLRALVESSQNAATKVEAVRALGIVAFYNDEDEATTQGILDFLLDVVESDGHAVDAGDDGDVVTAALQAWGFLATQMEDMEDESQAAMEAFVEQLDSADADVQVATGENVALLYEKSWTPIEEDDEVPKDALNPDAPPPTHIKRYEPYNQKHQLQASLSAIASTSAKRVSKKNRKLLHNNFADVAQSVEDPTLGPRYNSAMDEDGRTYGSRFKVKVGRSDSITIDRWWKLIRLRELKRVLASGFNEHYEHNEVVVDTLPDEL